ncbi:leucine-rich repeat domain-containing protein [Myxococcaceae bacterium JPH2]|nr:leucine-rich repeat domain-containing protein [Myxococcaceae bacterium JPH2]
MTGTPLHGARVVSEQELWPRVEAATRPEWRERLATEWRSATANGVLFHEGDLETDSLVIGPLPLVVAGDVRVKGLMEDSHAADNTLLVVLGTLEAERVATFATMVVTGDMRVQQVLVARSSGDGTCRVGGGLSVHTVVENGHFFQVHGALDVEVLVGGYLTDTGQPRQRLHPHEALLPGAWQAEEEDEDGVTSSQLDWDGLFTRLRRGEPLLEDTRLGPAGKAVAAVREKAARGEHVPRLGLALKRLTTIPEEVFSFTWLEHLTLDSNDIAVLSPRIGELKSLRSLSLESLPLTTLPESLGQLSELRTLSLRYCVALRQLPDVLGTLPMLEELFLDATALEGFPKVLLQLPRLKKLWWWRFDTMPMNQVEALVSGMARLPALTHAGFLQGHLLALPGNLARLAHLEQFKLGLKRIPEPEVNRLRAALPPGRLHVGY